MTKAIEHVKTSQKLSNKIGRLSALVLILYLIHFAYSLFGSVQVFENWHGERKDILQVSVNEWLHSYRANLTYVSFVVKVEQDRLGNLVEKKDFVTMQKRLKKFQETFSLDYIFIDTKDKNLISYKGIVSEVDAQKNRLFLKNFTEKPDFNTLKITKNSFISFESLLGKRINGDSELYIGLRIPIYNQKEQKIAEVSILKKAKTSEDATLERMQWVLNLKSMQFVIKTDPFFAHSNYMDKLVLIFNSNFHKVDIPVVNTQTGQVVGYYHFVESTAEIREIIYDSIKQSLIFFLILFLVFFYLSRVLKLKLLNPLAEITRVTADVSAGMTGERLTFMYDQNEKKWTEVEFFGIQFNHLLDGMVKKQQELITLNESLESTVSFRTSELTQLNKSLHKQARTDALTGIANRHSFEIYWGETVQKFLAEELSHVGIAIIDCDHFKSINDTYGHDVGDQILNIICRKIEENIGLKDFFVRLGGDEFAVIFTNKDSEEIMQTMQKVVELIKKYPTDDIGLHGNLSISAGVATANRLQQNDISEIIKHADTAMYIAKQNLNKKYVLYDKNKHKITEKELSHKNTTGVLNAIETGVGLSLLFQPIYNIKTQEIEYFELLSRFNLDGVCIYPNIFMPIIERTKMQVKFDKAVIRKSLEIITKGKIKKGSGISINLSAESLLDDSVCDWFAGFLPFTDDYKLVIEVTETSMIKHLAHVSKQIERFKGLGFKVALDDFGSGYSSISYLAHLPVNIIKFDISLTRAAFQKQRTAKLIQGLVNDLSEMDYDIVIEGVEDVDMFEMIKLMAPSHLQGFYINKPSAEPNYSSPNNIIE